MDPIPASSPSKPAEGLAPSSRHAEIALHLAGSAEEWRQLTELWGRHISSVRGQVEAAIVALTREFADIVERLDALEAAAGSFELREERLATLIRDSSLGQEGTALYRELVGNAQEMREDSSRIRQDIEAALVSFQFQDRIDQILGHVEANLHSIPSLLGDYREYFERTGRLEPIRFSALLEALEASYTTNEERQGHPGSAPAAQEDDITYF